jgi:hypothetical protein
LGPTPNPQSPIPNPQSPLKLYHQFNIKKSLINKNTFYSNNENYLYGNSRENDVKWNNKENIYVD